MRRDTFLKMICNGVLQIETSYFIVDFFLIILYLFEKDSVREEWKCENGGCAGSTPTIFLV
jgi:hypothetical protein